MELTRNPCCRSGFRVYNQPPVFDQNRFPKNHRFSVFGNGRYKSAICMGTRCTRVSYTLCMCPFLSFTPAMAQHSRCLDRFHTHKIWDPGNRPGQLYASVGHNRCTFSALLCATLHTAMLWNGVVAAHNRPYRPSRSASIPLRLFAR
jgi:hypothetical protein